MARKLYDLAVKTGSYTDSQGQTKNRYENIGVVLEGQDGPYLMMKRTFNPAGIPSERDTIIVSMFKPRDDNAQQQPQAQQPIRQQLDDDIPF